MLDLARAAVQCIEDQNVWSITAVIHCRAFDKTNKGAVDFSEFCDLHVFILRTQSSFRNLLPEGSSLLPYDKVSQALQEGGACALRYRTATVIVKTSSLQIHACTIAMLKLMYLAWPSWCTCSNSLLCLPSTNENMKLATCANRKKKQYMVLQVPFSESVCELWYT